MQLKKTYKVVRPSVVAITRQVTNSDGSVSFIAVGSGVYIHNSGIILTAYHVVKGMEELELPNLKILFTSQYKNEGTALNLMPIKMVFIKELDCAFIKVDKSNEEIEEILRRDYKPIKLPKIDDLEVGEDIATIGFPLRDEKFFMAMPDLFAGIISRIDYEMPDSDSLYQNIMLDINARRGNSGGPVFKSSNGELIGIIKESHLETNDKLNYDENECFKNMSEYISTTNMVNCIPWSKLRPIFEKFISEN